MPKSTPIRWIKSQEKELKKAIKNYNSRVRRARKRDPENADILPQTTTFKESKEQIFSRKDLEFYIKKLKNFTAKTAQPVENVHGVKATVWEVEEVRRGIRRENARRAYKERQKKQRDVYVGGKKIPGAVFMPTAATEKENKPIQENLFNKAKTSKEWTDTVKYIEKLTDKKRGMTDPEQYRQNTRRALSTIGIKDILIYAMYEVLGTDLLDKYDDGHPAADLSFIYDDENTSADDREEEIKLDLVEIIKNEGKQKEVFDTIYFQVDSETRAIWEQIGYNELLDIAAEGVNVRNKDELNKYLTEGKNEKKKRGE